VQSSFRHRGPPCQRATTLTYLTVQFPGSTIKIWSFQHSAWWRPNSRGYTVAEGEAGLYDRAEAEQIVNSANFRGRLEEEIVEIRQPPLRERIASIIRQINSQDNRATASPYHFAVQSKRWVDTVHDGEKEVVLYDGHLYTLNEWVESDPNSTWQSWEDLHSFWVRHEWEDRGIFLTEREALKFIKANRYHLTEPRTYVKHFWRNSEMETIMRAWRNSQARDWFIDEKPARHHRSRRRAEVRESEQQNPTMSFHVTVEARQAISSADSK
jgi:hypothetical protein